MNWKIFLKPTPGKALMTVFFVLVPIPLPAAAIAAFKAKYLPILTFPFFIVSTGYAYVALLFIFLGFYILACLISHLYHKYVLVKPQR